MAGRSVWPTARKWVGEGARLRASSVNWRGDQGRLMGFGVPQPRGPVGQVLPGCRQAPAETSSGGSVDGAKGDGQLPFLSGRGVGGEGVGERGADLSETSRPARPGGTPDSPS